MYDESKDNKIHKSPSEEKGLRTQKLNQMTRKFKKINNR